MTGQIASLNSAPTDRAKPVDVGGIAEIVTQSEHPFAVIMKPTDQHKLECGYCYVGDRRHTIRVSDQVLQASMEMQSKST